jgi:long-chain fatty acid transport protein
MLYEIATPDVGLASAGYAARAQDASTVFKNPAGMSLLTEPQLQGGLELLYGDVKFTPNGQTSNRLGSDDGGNAVGALPEGGLYYVHPLSEKWSVGIGMLSYFGLMENYDDAWVGRYYIQDGATLGMSFTPSASYKVNDWLSVGAGLNAMYGYFATDVAINNIDPLTGDGQLSLKDTTWGFGANVGVLVEPVKGTRIGITYLSPVKLDFNDTPSFSNLGPGLSALLANPGEIDLGMTVPQCVMLSFYHDLNEKVALMADFGWQNWNAFGKVDVGLNSSTSGDLTTDLDYQDTFHGAVGAIYQLSDQWQLTGGVAFDSSAVTTDNRTVTLPMGQAWRFGLGAIWRLNERIDLGAAYEFMWNGDLAVDQGSDLALRGRVSGSFDDTWFSFATLNVTWKF